MKTMIRTWSILLIGMISTLTVNAQEFQRSHFPERSAGWYTLGINGGFAYQSSDVSTTLNGYGLGLTLAKNYYYQPGSPISFDLRGRLLYSETVGLDHKRSTGILNNDALNGSGDVGGLDYSAANGGLGYVFQNHKTYHGEAGLEAVLTANRLRENTGIIISAFGGINLDYYHAKIDQSDNGGTYDYSVIDNVNDSKSSVKSILRNNILDGVYETSAHGFDDIGKIKFMPSLGLELGYQFTPRFSMHVAHKATFAGVDDLDGQLWDNNNNLTGTNDVHHYTNAALRWIIEPARKKVHRPEITIVRPRTSPYSTRTPNATILADVKYVNSAVDIEFRLNGQPWNIDFNGKRLRADVPLQLGRNEVLITATNSAGTDQESMILIFNDVRNEPPTLPPPPPPSTQRYEPQVNITSPRDNYYNTEYRDFTIIADVKNVSRKADIDFYVNGRAVYNFSFNNRNNRFTARLELKEGRNEIEVVARNEAGSDRDEVVINLEKKLAKPRVNITRPSRDPFETTEQQTRVVADVERVTRKNDINVKVNGRQQNDFDFRNGRVEIDVYLNQGRNTVVITGYNPSGEDSDQVVINYEQPNVPTVDAPRVRITSVNQTGSNQNGCKAIVKARIFNVTRKNDITLRVNGRRENFSFSNKTKLLTANINLRDGRNDIEIRAVNEGGSDQDEERTNCNAATPPPPPAAKPPVVKIETPKNNSTTTNSSVNLKARATNVRSKQGVSVKLNGNNVNSFSFNPLSGILTAQMNLKTGRNTITVVGQNNDGKDEESVRITFNTPSNPPTVNISTPNNNSTTNKDNTTVKATIKNVTRKQDITLRVNGQTTSNFSFNGSTLNAAVKLKAGRNTILVKAKNGDGNDEESVRITYNAPSNPPTVNINSPNNNSTTDKENATIKATIKNVTRKQDITLIANGQRISNFSFSGSTLSATIKLTKGRNTILVRAKNSDGQDDESVRITYTPKVAIPKPVVKFKNPARAGSSARSQRFTLRISVINVADKRGINLTFNGKALSKFNYDSRKKEVTATVNLKNGSNEFGIKATNASGSASARSSVAYVARPTVPKVQKPTIDITSVSQPAAHPSNPTNLRSTVLATISNLTSKDQITFTVNGTKVADFTFNAKTGKFQGSVALKIDGSANGFKLVAQNRAGKAEEDYTY